jgi:hypothetical protein
MYIICIPSNEEQTSKTSISSEYSTSSLILWEIS